MTKIKLAILQCDSVLSKFQAEFGDYPDMIKNLMSTNQIAKIDTQVFDVEHGQFPASNNDFNGFIISGSKASVYEELPWIRQLESFIREVNTQNQKTVGICFGHQVLAKALGGHVAKSEKGWGVGVMTSTVINKTSWMDPSKNSFNLVVSHQDQVVTLPDGAQLLAANSFCPNSMFQYGENMLAMQGHPEFSIQYSAALMNERAIILTPPVLDEGLASLTKPTDEKLIAEWIIRFFRN